MRDLTDRLPRKPQQVAENYNHLMEQPTIAYAVGLMLAVLGDQAAWAVSLAWAYTISRIAHSLVQGTFNHVLTRALLFTFGSMVLAILAARALLLSI